MIRFPTTVEEAAALGGPTTELRAGGTDWQERREIGRTRPDVIDLRDVEGLDRIDAGGGLTIGAKVRVARLAADPAVNAGWPALAKAAGVLATPQIRAAATVGGVLCQRARCWYYRSPDFRCHRSGGDSCPARAGDHHYSACFDLGPCVAPHPSTVGMALLTYDASITVTGGADRTVAELFGDGSDPTRGHTLADGEVLTSVRLGPALPGERGGYHRTIARAWAEWPLVEASVRLVVDGARIELARVAVGGVANIPLRLRNVEGALEGGPVTPGALEAAVARSVEGANPLPNTAYKLDLLPWTILQAIEKALA